MAGPFNLAIRFLLELAAVIAASVTGAGLGTPPFGVVGGIVGATAFVAIWGLFIAPRARFAQSPRVRLIVGTILMELVAFGLIVIGQPTVGAVLAAAVLVNAVALAAGGFDADDPNVAAQR
jgi:hypothetical protein